MDGEQSLVARLEQQASSVLNLQQGAPCTAQAL